MPDADTAAWTNIYFYHHGIDTFFNSLSGNVMIGFNMSSILILGFLALSINSWALHKIISHRVKTNEIGREVCKLATEFVGGVGPMIVNNVFSGNGYSIDQVSKHEVINLSDSIGEALGAYSGKLMAKEIQDEIKKITPDHMNNYIDIIDEDFFLQNETIKYSPNTSFEIEVYDTYDLTTAFNDIL